LRSRSGGCRPAARRTSDQHPDHGELYGDRITQVDMRVAKLLRFGRTRANVGLDIYNLLNSNVPLTYVTTYGTTWGRPQSVLDARFAKISAQIDF
jgi:hypothetical protein